METNNGNDLYFNAPARGRRRGAAAAERLRAGG
jgi:hypothetical protein